MTPEQRQRLIEILHSGNDVAPEWSRVIFPPEKREYELVYQGKEREEDVIANTLAVPLQPVRTFNQGDADWQNKLIFGDNLQAMKTLLDMKRRGELCNADGSPGVRLVYIDPPFATKRDFRGNQDQKAYQDKIAGAQFFEFLRKRLLFIRELLSDDGSVFIHLDWRKIHGMKVLMDEIFGESRLQNQIIWQRHDPHNDAVTRFGRIHDTLLWYSKAEKPIYNYKSVTDKLSIAATKEYSLLKLDSGAITNWNPDIDVGGRRFKLDDCTVKGTNAVRQFEWRGARPSSKRQWPADSPAEMDQLVRDEVLYLRNPNKGAARARISFLDTRTAQGQLPQDIWLNLGRMKGGSSYPTEKPELLLERVIRAASNAGDLVLDAFSGSGTTCAVAEKLGRRWIAIDCGKLAIYTIQKRLLNLKAEVGNKGKALAAKPFTLYNAGLYDFARLKELPWADWRRFALTLFGCHDDPKRIGGIQFDGTLKACPVQVFDHRLQGGVTITEETLSSIHEAAGSKIGTRMYIIAPALAFDFQQDYIEIGDVRYYALRIPYSIIHELHQREFVALLQPADALAVNDTVDAVGFDFIKTPELDYSLDRSTAGDSLLEEAIIRIKIFHSEAAVRSLSQRRGNRESLSMVMVDYDYDIAADVFDLDAVFYADAIEDAGWEVRFPAEQLGERIMAVFVDIYGNEARVVIPASSFGCSEPKKSSRLNKSTKLTVGATSARSATTKSKAKAK